MLDKLTPDLVLSAYMQGIFPMGEEDGTVRWYSPDPRCIIELDEFHVSSRMARRYRSGKFDCRVDTVWDEVMRACADRESTWISPEIIDVYTELHQMGFAHSVEVFHDGSLAGGLYGVSIGGVFMGESMFHRVTDASKVALIYLVNRLKGSGFAMLDCQYMTSHLSTFNAKLISRDQYLSRLGKAIKIQCRF